MSGLPGPYYGPESDNFYPIYQIQILPLDKIIILDYNNGMKTNKALARDKKIFKKKHGMRISGKSVFLTQEILVKKGKQND